MSEAARQPRRLNGELRATEVPRGDIAKQLMQDRFAVFPLVPGEKTPATEHSFHDASTDFEQARRWWQERDYNIGIATGNPSGVFVVDVDPRNSGDRTWAALCEVHDDPDTERVETSRFAIEP